MTIFRTHAVRLALLGAVAGAGLMASAGASQAVVYCRAVGYPKGCVVRPTGAVVVRPAPAAGTVVVAPRRVIYCTRPGYPRGCVVR